MTNQGPNPKPFSIRDLPKAQQAAAVDMGFFEALERKNTTTTNT